MVDAHDWPARRGYGGTLVARNNGNMENLRVDIGCTDRSDPADPANHSDLANVDDRSATSPRYHNAGQQCGQRAQRIDMAPQAGSRNDSHDSRG
jgi:hypothetical protein